MVPPYLNLPSLLSAGGNVDGKFSVGYRDAVVRTVVGLDRETTAAYTLVLEAIGKCALRTVCSYSRQSSHWRTRLGAKTLWAQWGGWPSHRQANK